MSESAILSARGLSRHFEVDGGTLKAVSNVDLEIFPRETLAVVGESGCGKSTLSRLLLALTPPTSGSLCFDGRNTAEMSREEWRRFRREVQPVFQNPYASLNPRMRVEGIVAEPLRVAGSGADRSRKEVKRRVGEALEATGLSASDGEKYPHQFSGGQRQRIAIARAIISRPRLIVLDEPVSSQDISIQAQILNLLKDLQDALGISYLFIAHDLATVRFMSDRLAVMYLGKVVESGPCEVVFAEPFHPYTRALLASALPEHPGDRQTIPGLYGEIPSPLHPPAGCRFHTRCPAAVPECSNSEPSLQLLGCDRKVACPRVEVSTERERSE
ncbi:ABC transporter ATP-binding protein [Gilvimarinus sp. F26214L]|uniref:ABC transporter ATP-binding protein n=1 Tax=Gilvimarinus sp. DZF01 TaxID=3461371 RepID=UPI0040461E18